MRLSVLKKFLTFQKHHLWTALETYFPIKNPMTFDQTELNKRWRIVAKHLFFTFKLVSVAISALTIACEQVANDKKKERKIWQIIVDNWLSLIIPISDVRKNPGHLSSVKHILIPFLFPKYQMEETLKNNSTYWYTTALVI